MRFLITFLFAFIATATAFPELHLLETRKDKNGTFNGDNSVKKQCKQLNKMIELTELAANQTKLSAFIAKGKLNDAEVQAIKDKAANVTTTLKALQANATLVDECNVIEANNVVKAQCKVMKALAKTAALANNQTAMDAFLAKMKLNDTQVTKFKEQITKAETKLQQMQANATLTDLCAQQKQQKGEDNSDGATGDTAANSKPAQQATSGGGKLTMRTLPYVFVPTIAGVFALFL